MSTSSKFEILGALKELAPALIARSEEIEERATIPPDLIAALKATGVFRMLVPRSHGGEELSLMEVNAIIEEASRIDGSTGWTVAIGSETPQLFAMLPRTMFDSIYSGTPDVVTAGVMAPQGEAREDSGAYVVTGRWSFATGCEHSEWFYGNCRVKPRAGHSNAASDTTEVQYRTAVFPAKEGRIVPNWKVLGMRGSGSHDIAAEGIAVPVERMFDAYDCAPCIRSPTFVMPALHIPLHLSSVAIGIAQAAVDEVVALAKAGKKRLYARDSLIESSAFRNQLGRNIAGVRAGRAMVRDAAERFWALCAEGKDAATEMAPEIMSATSWVVETCAGVVNSCYRTSGASTIRNGSALQRRFRDINVVTQHVAASEGWFGQAGAVALGVPFALKS